MTAVPAYDLKLDELRVALGYATIGVKGPAAKPSEAVAKAMTITPVGAAPAKTKAAPKKAPKKAEKKEEKKKEVQ